MNEPTSEAVEAAAKAFAYGEDVLDSFVEEWWPKLAAVEKGNYRRRARAVLSAALPLILADHEKQVRKKVAGEVLEIANSHNHAISLGFHSAKALAARIVRGEGE